MATILKQVYPFFGEPEVNISDPTLLRLARNVSMASFAVRASQQLEEALDECKWMSQNIDCREYFRSVVTTMGLCHTFNSVQFIEGHGGKPMETHGTGAVYGLYMRLNVQQDEYTYGPSTSAGFRVSSFV